MSNIQRFQDVIEGAKQQRAETIGTATRRRALPIVVVAAVVAFLSQPSPRSLAMFALLGLN